MIVSYGLIAGICFEEMQEMRPGMVLDLFVYRRSYDDQQHGIQRE